MDIVIIEHFCFYSEKRQKQPIFVNLKAQPIFNISTTCNLKNNTIQCPKILFRTYFVQRASFLVKNIFVVSSLDKLVVAIASPHYEQFKCVQKQENVFWTFISTNLLQHHNLEACNRIFNSPTSIPKSWTHTDIVNSVTMFMQQLSVENTWDSQINAGLKMTKGFNLNQVWESVISVAL